MIKDQTEEINSQIDQNDHEFKSQIENASQQVTILENKLRQKEAEMMRLQVGSEERE
jgi:hypothetical protein